MTVEEFTSTRVGFAIIDNCVVFQEDDERITVRDWLKEKFNLPNDVCERTVCGGLFADRIAMHIGSTYASVDLDKVSANQMLYIFQHYVAIYGKQPNCISNGQYIGEVGTKWRSRVTINL